MTKRSGNIKCICLKNELADRITAGEFPFGSRFPGLNELCKVYKVSYVTVCKAVKFLENEGYLRCQPGIGYFVCYSGPDTRTLSKEVNIISTSGYYRNYRQAFDSGIRLFEENKWKVNLLFSKDLYDLKPAINSPDAFSIITAFNVNWERFSATFGHIAKRVIVLGRLSGNPEITGIVADECASIRLCMDFLASRNRRKVALIAMMPRSELESIRIAAWRNIISSSQLSFAWMNRHLLSLNADTAAMTPEQEYKQCKQFLMEIRHDTDAVILPSPMQMMLNAANDLGIKIPEDLDVVTIGYNQEFFRKNPEVSCMDNNFAGHFQCAFDILEERFASNSTVPGSWYFCQPSGIIAKQKTNNLIK